MGLAALLLLGGCNGGDDGDDLTLYGTEAAARALSENACSTCEPGLWTVDTKHLETLHN